MMERAVIRLLARRPYGATSQQLAARSKFDVRAVELVLAGLRDAGTVGCVAGKWFLRVPPPRVNAERPARGKRAEQDPRQRKLF